MRRLKYPAQTRYEGEEPISSPNNLYNPNALAEQLKTEARRSPISRLGTGGYGDAGMGSGSVADARRYAERNSARRQNRG